MSHIFCFFFSSRRRHTRWTGDWSSDVCSSDLLSASPNQLLPSANSWRRGHLWSLGQVAVRRQLVGGVLGRKRCCTSVLYGALAGRHATWSQARVKCLTLAGARSFVSVRRAGQMSRPHVSERERPGTDCNPSCSPAKLTIIPLQA